MRFATDSQVIDCPYCGESYELIVDVSESEQRYIEDCYVCCAPIQFTVTVAGGAIGGNGAGGRESWESEGIEGNIMLC